ncbi:non-reducing end alpha-L-arabinofuranosidase family hydrolase [Cellvibrio sp. QJXJ]|uniref:non-reducing end alpha-L-arabinofuranosidase family hydrolase n=1 Tax=Cellvibrio sp. QJXJ TaxID=2964606 RepID=UPI0021C367D2|nr:non-reducing end alpha-L-arabinofuranosidase family hydrolase [Cellvibrio sp. QJXJ]UUA72884.1 cellulose binding domain-containing protein [Cellvibrio sp. QJXJ]
MMNKQNNSVHLLPPTLLQLLRKSCGVIGLGASLLAMTNLASAACTYTVDNEWSTGYTASITVKNDTNAAVNNWSVNWQYGSNRITNSWNANLSGSNPYTATNMSWNGNIAAGQSVSFGFQVNKNGGSAERPTINGSLCGGAVASSSSRASVAPSSIPASSSPSSSAAVSSAPANNFAQNGGVESGLTNWGTTAATVTRSTADKRSGSASALISGRTAAWHGLTFAVGSLTSGNQYDAAVWVKLAPGTPDSVITLTAKRLDDSDTSTYNEYTHVATITASSSEWRLLQGYYTQLGATAFQHFIIEATDTSISYYADDFSVAGQVTQIPSSSSSSSSSSSAQTCELKAPLRWTSTGPLISPKNANWKSIKDPSVVKYNGTYHVYATYYDTSYKSMYTSFTDWNTAQQAPHISMNGTTVGNAVAPQVFYFRPHNKWYLITQWAGAYSTTDDISRPNWTAKRKLLQGEPAGSLDFWVICNATHCYLYFSRDDGVLYMSKTTIANFPNFSGYSIVMEDHRGNGNQYLFEAPNVYKLDGQNKYLLLVEAWPSGPRMFRSWTSTSLDGPWTPLADTDANPFAGNNNVEWPTGKWANGISHGELIRSGYDERLTVDPCNLEFLYQGEAGPSPDGNYNTIPYKLGLLRLKK